MLADDVVVSADDETNVDWCVAGNVGTVVLDICGIGIDVFMVGNAEAPVVVNDDSILENVGIALEIAFGLNAWPKYLIQNQNGN